MMGPIILNTTSPTPFLGGSLVPDKRHLGISGVRLVPLGTTTRATCPGLTGGRGDEARYHPSFHHDTFSTDYLCLVRYGCAWVGRRVEKSLPVRLGDFTRPSRAVSWVE